MTGQPDRPQADNQDRPAADEPLPEDAGAESTPSADNGELGVLQAQADENWDKYLRAMAELDNVRKRSQRDVENARKYALEPFARELLNVRDSLEMGLATSAGAEPEPLRQGFEATLKQLATTMEQFGIEVLDPHGEPFDPQQHEAMAMQPSPDVEPGTVLTVYQKGYSLNGRLLRPARVVVSAAVDAD
ncbi:nucleotide exchange factor GrpE [Woeseia oceani]|uniref:Protein GrpE n=1 Tax=Woeseia oceani TaxID=1548547 RepID=A0A193LG88_9GAMM|nr:nucleotide exchange factor GrpE [Woeseia oceani]ANO51527.1 nucleotide exchange factor GrpE [Woeseia oceani]